MDIIHFVGKIRPLIGELCNGSTYDSDSYRLGSNPSSPAIRLHGQAVKTLPSQGRIRGSIPLGGAKTHAEMRGFSIYIICASMVKRLRRLPDQGRIRGLLPLGCAKTHQENAWVFYLYYMCLHGQAVKTPARSRQNQGLTSPRRLQDPPRKYVGFSLHAYFFAGRQQICPCIHSVYSIYPFPFSFSNTHLHISAQFYILSINCRHSR